MPKRQPDLGATAPAAILQRNDAACTVCVQTHRDADRRRRRVAQERGDDPGAFIRQGKVGFIAVEGTVEARRG